MPIQVGDVLGDYQVIGVLGRGGMGKVYRVRSMITEREEAMKVVLPDFDENPTLADRFLREIKVHASLQHPNIATLHSALRIGHRLVMLLELVEGVSLEEKLREGPLDPATAVHHIGQVLSALAFAHAHAVIHRDIKPANILIASGGTIKLTDFGIARAAESTRLTGTGLAVGTLAYMSPEQIRSAEVDARSDLYSLGLTFYEMVTGRRAILGDTEHDLMNAQLHTTPPDPVAVNPLVPPVLSAVIMRALVKEPAGRFQTALEFEAALRGQTSVPPPVASEIPPAELAELETRLTRAIGPIARRLVADAARRHSTLPEIRRALAGQIDDPKERERFLKTNPATLTLATRTPTAPAGFDPALLERLAKALAQYLGPIAEVLVRRAARTAPGEEELRDRLAAEIASDEERRRFLAAVR